MPRLLIQMQAAPNWSAAFLGSVDNPLMLRPLAAWGLYVDWDGPSDAVAVGLVSEGRSLRPADELEGFLGYMHESEAASSPLYVLAARHFLDSGVETCAA